MTVSSSPKSVAIITMSTRTPRVGPHVASLIHSLLSSSPLLTQHSLSLAQVDLASFPLPVYNEPYIIPAMLGTPGGPTSFTNPTAVAWSEEVAKHDAYVLVIPEYNYGLAGGTKNAIDYLMNEWKGKPVMVVTYGIKGGYFAGEQVRGILSKMGLKVVGKKVELSFSREGAEGHPHGLGVDMLAAMLKGELGGYTRGSWLGDGEEGSGRKGDVEEAFGELVGLLTGTGTETEKKEEEKKD